VKFTISGRRFELTRAEVEEVMQGAIPESTDARHRYVAEINDAWFPIKQVIERATGLGRVEFTAQPAYHVLSRLGFRIRDVRRVERGDGDTGQPGIGARATKKFTVTLERDEDDYYVASCPALKGCHSQGRSRQEALLNISEAIRAYLESMRQRGESVPEVETVEVEVAA
jgi:predicted RNase H-like HicB family nuclease